MDFLQKPPDWLLKALPEGVQEYFNGGAWFAILGLFGLVVLFALWGVGSKFFGLFKRRPAPPLERNLAEDLSTYVRLPPSTGDRRLLVEGVPVRLRLVVAAPSGVATRINSGAIIKLLDNVLLGLGDIAAHDQPRIAIWPGQLSYEGFANTFHRNTMIPEGEHAPTPWVLLAGRAMIGKHQVMLGLGLQALKPHTIGRRTLKAHEWDTVLRVRVRD